MIPIRAVCAGVLALLLAAGMLVATLAEPMDAATRTTVVEAAIRGLHARDVTPEVKMPATDALRTAELLALKALAEKPRGEAGTRALAACIAALEKPHRERIDRA